jgi:hypothetical protein
MAKNASIEEYCVPVGDRSLRKKYSITKFVQDRNSSHLHHEFRTQIEREPVSTYGVSESEIVKSEMRVRHHAGILKSYARP